MKTAVMFSGQGSQYPGMMRDVIDAYPECGEVFSLAKEILGRDLYDCIMNSSQETLNETINTQPCMLVCELAALRVLKKLGVPYDAVAGFSLGEWGAVVAAGAVSEEDAIRLIEKRARAMQRAVPIGQGAMAFMLGQEDEFIEKFCQGIGDVAPANYNGYGNVSVAGTAEAVKRFLEKAAEEKLIAGQIPVSIPSHSPLMQPAAAELSPVIREIEMCPPCKELLMNATGSVANTVNEIKENLIHQLIRPVKFRQMTVQLLEEGYDTFIEVGPGETLGKVIKRTAKKLKRFVKAYSCSDLEAVQTIVQVLVPD